MGFTQAIRTCLGNYAVFRGRAPRPEFWWFFLFSLIGGLVFGALDMVLFGTGLSSEVAYRAGNVEASAYAFEMHTQGPLGLIFSLAILLPSLAVGVRRMHDTGRSALYLFYPFIVMLGVYSFAALIGANPMAMGGGLVGVVLGLAMLVLALSPFIVLWWLARPSQPGSNAYGPNPYEVIS